MCVCFVVVWSYLKKHYHACKSLFLIIFIFFFFIVVGVLEEGILFVEEGVVEGRGGEDRVFFFDCWLVLKGRNFLVF